MKMKLSTRQVMSLYSGCSYVHGKLVADAAEFMIGSRAGIAVMSFQPIIAEELLQQFQWLSEVPKYSMIHDWELLAKTMEAEHGSEQCVLMHNTKE